MTEISTGPMIRLAATAAMAAACGSSEPATVTQNHTQADFVQENVPFLWAASDYDSYRQTESGRRLADLPLEPEHPLTQRVQTWLDRLDEAVRESFRSTTGEELAAPQPVATVLRSRTMFGAFVAPVEACTSATFVGSMPEQATRPGDVAMLQREDLRPWTGLAYCIDQPEWEAAGLVDFWNAQEPRCALSQGADGRIHTGPECGNVWPAENLGLTSVSPFIHFSTDLLASISEDALVVLAAHELGHYYRAHVSPQFRDQYDFWYEDGAGLPNRPLPADDEDELKEAYQELVRAPKPLAGPDHEGVYSPRLASFLTNAVATQLQMRGEEDFVCADARDALGSWVLELREGEIPAREVLDQYAVYETALHTCASSLPLGEAGPNEVSAGAVLFGAKREGPNAAVVMQWGDTLGTYLDRLDGDARELDEKAAKLYRRLSDNRIGWYTTEQEADEIAMELATRIGLTPERVLAGWLDFMAEYDVRLEKRHSSERLERIRAEGEIDAGTCRALLESGWMRTDETGRREPVLVKLGSLFDPHHAGCYRLYRMWREAESHQYVVGAQPEPLSPSWDELQQLAREL